MIKILFYIFVVFYVIYVVNRFLSRFYFQKFNNSQQDLLREMLRRQQMEFEKQKNTEGKTHIENNRTQKRNSNSGGEYIDYEVVK